MDFVVAGGGENKLRPYATQQYITVLRCEPSQVYKMIQCLNVLSTAQNRCVP